MNVAFRVKGVMNDASSVRRAQAAIGDERRQTQFGGIESRQLVQCDIVERAPNRGVHALPAHAHPALPFDAAAACRTATLGDRDRTLEHIQYLGGGDVFRTAASR